MDLEDRINHHYRIWPQNGLGNDFNGLRTHGIYAYSTISTIFRHFPLGNLSKSRILDFGSGTGRLSKLIVDHVKEIICADISPLYLKDCKKNLKEYKNCQFHEIKNTPLLGFEDNFFDFSFSYLSINQNQTKEEFKKCLLEIDRVSKNFAIRLCRIKNYDLGVFAKRKAFSNLECLCCFEELNELFAKKNYIFEVLDPEPKVGSGALFVYKISDDIDLHMKFGPHRYEQALNLNVDLLSRGSLLSCFFDILSISPLQYLKYLSRKIKSFKIRN